MINASGPPPQPKMSISSPEEAWVRQFVHSLSSEASDTTQRTLSKQPSPSHTAICPCGVLDWLLSCCHYWVCSQDDSFHAVVCGKDRVLDTHDKVLKRVVMIVEEHLIKANGSQQDIIQNFATKVGKLHERMLAIVQPLLEKKEKGEHIPARELKNIKKLCELIEQMEKALHDEAKTAQALQAEKQTLLAQNTQAVMRMMAELKLQELSEREAAIKRKEESLEADLDRTRQRFEQELNELRQASDYSLNQQRQEFEGEKAEFYQRRKQAKLTLAEQEHRIEQKRYSIEDGRIGEVRTIGERAVELLALAPELYDKKSMRDFAEEALELGKKLQALYLVVSLPIDPLNFALRNLENGDYTLKRRVNNVRNVSITLLRAIMNECISRAKK